MFLRTSLKIIKTAGVKWKPEKLKFLMRQTTGVSHNFPNWCWSQFSLLNKKVAFSKNRSDRTWLRTMRISQSTVFLLLFRSFNQSQLFIFVPCSIDKEVWNVLFSDIDMKRQSKICKLYISFSYSNGYNWKCRLCNVCFILNRSS